jgi:hypothetical protein
MEIDAQLAAKLAAELELKRTYIHAHNWQIESQGYPRS